MLAGLVSDMGYSNESSRERLPLLNAALTGRIRSAPEDVRGIAAQGRMVLTHGQNAGAAMEHLSQRPECQGLAYMWQDWRWEGMSDGAQIAIQKVLLQDPLSQDSTDKRQELGTRIQAELPRQELAKFRDVLAGGSIRREVEKLARPEKSTSISEGSETVVIGGIVVKKRETWPGLGRVVLRAVEPGRVRILLVLLVGALLASSGCSGGASNGATAALPPATEATIQIRHILARALPMAVTELEVSCLDDSGSVVFGPRTFPRQAEISLVVSVRATLLRIDYLAGSGRVGTFEQSIRLIPGETLLVVDPDFSPIEPSPISEPTPEPTATVQPVPDPSPQPPASTPGEGALRLDLFRDPKALESTGGDLAGLPYQTLQTARARAGEARAPAMRWTGLLTTGQRGPTRYRIEGSGSVRLFLDGQLLVGGNLSGGIESQLQEAAGEGQDFRLDYEPAGPPDLRLLAGGPGEPFSEVPSADFQPFQKPLLIQHGGLFVGSWRSSDPNRSVVTIATDEPVVLARSQIEGWTQSNDDRLGLVHATSFGYRVVLKDCALTGHRPARPRAQAARAFNGLNPASLRIENCDISSTTGIRVLRFGNFPPAERIIVRYNRANNLDGSRDDGTGSPIPWVARQLLGGGGFELGSFGGSFLHLNAVTDQPNVEVAWNQIINQPGASCTEDIFSLFSSGGTPSSPVLLHDNFVLGGYTATPERAGESTDATHRYFWTDTGAGMNLGDNAELRDVGYVRCFDNQIVGVSNSGIGVAGGHSIEIYQNRVVSDGRLPDGRTDPSSFTGIAAWDFYNSGPLLFYAITVRDNLSGCVAAGQGRNDYEYRVAGPAGLEPDPLNPSNPVDGVTTRGNQGWPVDPVTSDESEEELLWQQKLSGSGVHPGNRYTLP